MTVPFDRKVFGIHIEVRIRGKDAQPVAHSHGADQEVRGGPLDHRH